MGVRVVEWRLVEKNNGTTASPKIPLAGLVKMDDGVHVKMAGFAKGLRLHRYWRSSLTSANPAQLSAESSLCPLQKTVANRDGSIYQPVHLLPKRSKAILGYLNRGWIYEQAEW
jgi:hypothetical protein